MIGSVLLKRNVYILNACSIIFFTIAAVVTMFLSDQVGCEDTYSSSLENSTSAFSMNDDVNRHSSFDEASVDHLYEKKVSAPRICR